MVSPIEFTPDEDIPDGNMTPQLDLSIWEKRRYPHKAKSPIHDYSGITGQKVIEHLYEQKEFDDITLEEKNEIIQDFNENPDHAERVANYYHSVLFSNDVEEDWIQDEKNYDDFLGRVKAVIQERAKILNPKASEDEIKEVGETVGHSFSDFINAWESYTVDKFTKRFDVESKDDSPKAAEATETSSRPGRKSSGKGAKRTHFLNFKDYLPETMQGNTDPLPSSETRFTPLKADFGPKLKPFPVFGTSNREMLPNEMRKDLDEQMKEIAAKK